MVIKLKPWQEVIGGIIFIIIGVVSVIIGKDLMDENNEKSENFIEVTGYVVDYEYQDKYDYESPAAGVAVKTFDYNFATIKNITTSDITDSSITVTVDATAGDNPISNYYFSIDGKKYIDNSTNNVYTFTNLEEETEYNINAYVTDTLNYNSANYNLNTATEAVTELALDISLGNIVINEGSTENTLYVSGGGLAEQIEIDNTLPIVITGTTEEYGIDIYGGTSNITSNITLNNVNISGGSIDIGSYTTINLYIEGENTINLNYGVAISLIGTSTLKIDGLGSLSVTGGTGIVNSGVQGIGTIIINSGTISAVGNINAGIGGGDLALVEINGGNVTAISTGTGAGIGGGTNSSVTGEIRINGGTVYAQGGMLAAGIGGGGMYQTYCGIQSTAPNIYISDSANVTAIAGGVYNDHDTPPENIGSGGFSC